MKQEQKFRAIIEDAGNGGAFVTIPFDVEQIFGKKRVKIKATIAGEPYRGSLVRMGGACHVLGIRKEIREKTGKTFGDEIEIVFEEDTEPREIAIPQDIGQALTSNPEAETFFKQLSYTHQKEYIEWIANAKRDRTRQDRIGQVINFLKQGKKELASRVQK